MSGEDKRPDIIIVERDNVYIFELTIGFETNVSTNSERKNKSVIDEKKEKLDWT